MTRARDLADSADKDIAGTLTLDGLTVESGTSGITVDTSVSLSPEIKPSQALSDLIVSGTGNGGHLKFKTNSSERMRITSDGSVGLGTSDPSTPRRMDVVGSASDSYSSTNSITDNVVARFRNASDSSTAQRYGGISLESGNAQFAVQTVQTGTYGGALTIKTRTGASSYAERLRINSSGNLLFNGDGVVSVQSASSNMYIGGGTYTPAELNLQAGTSFMRMYTNGSERMRITSSGSVGIGTSSPATALHVNGQSTTKTIVIKTFGSNVSTGFLGGRSDWTSGATDNNFAVAAYEPNMCFFTNGSGTERMRIDSSGNVGIGASSPDVFSRGYTRTVSISSSGSTALAIQSAGGPEYPAIEMGRGSSRQFLITNEATKSTIGTLENTPLTFLTNSSERARLDASGNLLVGSTNNSPATNNVAGSSHGSLGNIQASVDGNPCLFVNRKSNDGDIISIRKDGSTVGSIGNDGSNMYIGKQSGLQFQGNDIISPNKNGVASDNTIDLGQSSARFDDIYATNGTIQTSDRNEKQDIEELSDAEQRVAVAAKGLLRKFRWKDAVAEKGDEARTHFGIIAQDLQAAFAAEGLDAGDYAMFIHTTWTDEETGEERSRMGVRYSELLAFIIAAI